MDAVSKLKEQKFNFSLFNLPEDGHISENASQLGSDAGKVKGQDSEQVSEQG